MRFQKDQLHCAKVRKYFILTAKKSNGVTQTLGVTHGYIGKHRRYVHTTFSQGALNYICSFFFQKDINAIKYKTDPNVWIASGTEHVCNQSEIILAKLKLDLFLQKS